ncbi:MAG: WG repeat-containing protein [Clostridia bacterium]|nr:WG repeat-containing protein [Clostridia bacterium]
MLEKYIYIFDAIVFITGVCSFFINLKRDKSMFSSVISILIGVFGVFIANFIYVIVEGKWLNGKLTIIIYAVMEFIEILLLFKKKRLKAFFISICLTILIAISILYANQLEVQSIFNYGLDNQSNTAVIKGFNRENKESHLEIPMYIVKGVSFYKVTSISEKAFYGCEKLYHVKLPNSITNIGNYAFAECKSLYDINIPYDLETLGARAFCNTSLKDEIKLENIKLKNDINLYDYLNDYVVRDYRNYNFDHGIQYYGFNEELCLTEIGFIDKTGKIMIDNTNYTPVRNFSEGLAPVYKDKKYGFIDVNGNVVIDFQYDKVYDFSEGLACVGKDGKFGYINTKGETIIDFQYDDPSIRSGAYISGKDFGLFIKGIACVKKDGKFGYIDTKGNVLVDFEFSFGYSFYDGIALTSKGYIDKNGDVVIDETNYSATSSFSNELAVAERDGKYGYIDTKGNVIIDFKYDYAYKFSDGLAVVEKDGNLGYIDNKGNVIIDFEYKDANDFSEGLASVYKDGKYGYINTKGEVVIDFQFDDAYDFSEKMTLVRKDGKYQFINKNGETVIDKVEVNEIIFAIINNKT